MHWQEMLGMRVPNLEDIIDLSYVVFPKFILLPPQLFSFTWSFFFNSFFLPPLMKTVELK